MRLGLAMSMCAGAGKPPAPSAVGVAPATGSTAGGTHIVIEVANSAIVDSASAAGVALTGFARDDATHVSGATGAHAAGAVDVVVTGPGGTSTLAGAFTYATPFTPTSLNMTSYQKGAYAPPLPWAGAASAGISGTMQETHVNNDPTAGTSVNGVAPAKYGGTNQNSTLAYISGGAAVDIADMVTVSAYTVWGLIYITSTGAPHAGPYTNDVALSGDARFGVMLSTSGIGIWHYTGAFPIVRAACSTGAWHFFCIRYDGVNAQVDVDNVDGTPTAIANIAALAGVGVTTGFNGFAVAQPDFSLMERGTLKTRISDATRDNLYAYCKTTYPAMALP